MFIEFIFDCCENNLNIYLIKLSYLYNKGVIRNFCCVWIVYMVC